LAEGSGLLGGWLGDLLHCIVGGFTIRSRRMVA
jgi:hypothetical protein